MKTKTLALCALMMGSRLLAEVPTTVFIDAISWKESKHDDRAVRNERTGDEARGRFQIRQCVLDDVNRIYGTGYSRQDCFNKAKATAILRMYLSYWGEYYRRQEGRPATVEVLARIWNGGPEGWRKRSTLGYWCEVQKQISRTIYEGA